MRKMKKIAAACMVAALVVMIYPNMESNTLTVSAHRGRTHSYESSHYNTERTEPKGAYYYCDGHSAHLHSHGVCPYADETVSENSVSGNNAASYHGRHQEKHARIRVCH